LAAAKARVALTNIKKVLILDEPTSGVDPIRRDSFLAVTDQPVA
jgi:ABC-type multidrug transport system ATPase subunit